MAEVLDARVLVPQEVTCEEAAGHDLVDFGSGVFAQRMHLDLLSFVRLVRALSASSRQVFVREVPLRSAPRALDVSRRDGGQGWSTGTPGAGQ
ncbi:NADPH-dependent FMN reductase family protein [Streptomyces vinaceus]|uniref:hypothetical protein n=1 Tax=Streptomyces vinaceus TaxID=1960 RepID=UPI00367DE129